MSININFILMLVDICIKHDLNNTFPLTQIIFNQFEFNILLIFMRNNSL